MKVEDAACPTCGDKTLQITDQLVARPIGTWSLPGVQLKVSALRTPFLSCWNCALRVEGAYDDDGHAVFPNPEA